jgi:hypothetical protein
VERLANVMVGITIKEKEPSESAGLLSVQMEMVVAAVEQKVPSVTQRI